MEHRITTQKRYNRSLRYSYFVAFVHIIENDQMIWAEKTKAKRLTADDARLDALQLLTDIKEQNGIVVNQ